MPKLETNTVDLQEVLEALNNKASVGVPTLQDKTIVPSDEEQTITADREYDGLNIVTVEAIPSSYIVTSDATASANEILSGEVAYANGTRVVGTMTNNGSISRTMDGINTKSVSIPAGYTSGGTVGLDNTIDNEVNTQADLIAQIKTALQNKASGAAEIETCTVTISTSEDDILTVCYTACDNGMITYVSMEKPYDQDLVLNNVVRNSIIYWASEFWEYEMTVTGNITKLTYGEIYEGCFACTGDGSVSLSFSWE